MPHQPASLHLLGQPALDCVITDISKDQINLETHNTLKNHPFKKGDIADILVSNIQLDNAKISATIEKVDGSTILLSCIDSQSPTLKLLVDSFTSPFTNHINNEQEIIQELYQISIEQLSSMLNTFFEEADHRLLHLAENSSNNTQQNKLYEVKNLLRQYRNDIQRHYFDFIKARFNHHTQPLTETNDSTPPPTYENLELIDLVEFEDWLSLNKIIKIIQDRIISLV